METTNFTKAELGTSINNSNNTISDLYTHIVANSRVGLLLSVIAFICITLSLW